MKKRILSFLLLLILMFAYAPTALAITPDPDGSPEKAKAIERLRRFGGDIDYSENGGNVRLSGALSGKATPGVASAIRFIEANKALFDIKDPSVDLESAGTRKDDLGNTFVEFTEEVGGVPVEGGELTVRFKKGGVITGVFGYIPEDKTVTRLGDDAEISADKAIEIAKGRFTYDNLKTEPVADKLITRVDGKNYVAYRVSIHYVEQSIGSYDVYVEAFSGKILRIENRIRDNGPTTGTGVDVQGKTRKLDLYLQDGRYYMTNYANPACEAICTFSLHNGTDYGYSVFSSKNTFNSEEYKASVSAHDNANRVLNFYSRLFGRKSIDGYGKEIDSYTHYDHDYVNAFWDGYELVYGDGDGVNYTYMSGDLDVVAHELTHAVSEYTARFSYHNESGAVSESVSDVFGVLVETYDKYNVAGGGAWQFNPADWVVGDELCLPSNPDRAIRSLADPGLYGQPGNMDEYQDLPDTDDGDNGGVHENSGIMNKAAYLVAGQIGMEKTARIYYRALTYYMGMYTTFVYSCNDLIQAARDFYGSGSAAEKAIRKAFGEVGVTDPVVDNDPYEPNDSMQTAYPITIGSNYASYISSSSDEDYYVLLIGSTCRIHATLGNLAGSYKFGLYEADGSRIIGNAYSGYPSVWLEATLTPGPYYLYVSSGGSVDTTKMYSLTVSTVDTTIVDTYEPNDSTSSAYAIDYGMEYQSYLSTAYDEDYYKFIVDKESNVYIKCSDIFFTLHLYRVDPRLVDLINLWYTSEYLQGKYYYCRLSAGTYYLKFEGPSSSNLRKKYSFHILKDYVPQLALNIDKQSIMLNTGDRTVLFASITPSDATSKTVLWESSNTNVAIVDQLGNVSAISQGSATITARTEEQEFESSCTVAVKKPVSGVMISPGTLNLYTGGSASITAKVIPSDATYKNVTWTSSDPSIASVNNIGMVSALQPGTTTIKATTMDGGFTAGCVVTVSSAALGMTLDRTSATLNVGKSVTLKAVMTPAEAPSGTVYWSSTNGYVATVDKNGKVTGVSAGTTVITAISENGGFKAACTVIVTTLPAPSSINVSSASATSLKITWAAVSGANGYEVYHATSPKGKYTRVASTAGTSYTNAKLSKGRTYYYKVRAFKTVLTTVFGPYSAIASAKAKAAAPNLD